MKFWEHFEINLSVLSKNEIMNRVQKIFDEWLEKQPIVYGKKDLVADDGTLVWWSGIDDNPTITHTARLVDVRPIEKKCEHILVKSLYVNGHSHWIRYICQDCGIALKPTGWREV